MLIKIVYIRIVECKNTSTMTVTDSKYPGLSTKQRATMIFHSAIVILIGSFAGFAWLIALAGYLQLWPLPPIELSVPDQKELWRNAHVGPIVHGMLVVLVASLGSILTLTKKEAKILVIAGLVEVWGNAIGFSVAPYTTNRGLSPDGFFLNKLSYFTFYPAVIGALIVVILLMVGSYRTMKKH